MTDRATATKLRIVPEPTPEERQAIAQALADADALPPAYRSAWRRSGAPSNEDELTPEPGGEEPNGAL